MDQGFFTPPSTDLGDPTVSVLEAVRASGLSVQPPAELD
jgi:hypothetical protein